MGRKTTTLGWLVTRSLVLVLFFGPHAWVRGDIDYFALSLDRLGHVGIGHTLVEYPLPGVALLLFPWVVTHLLLAHPGWYAEAVLTLALATDAAFLVLLHHFGRERRTAALWVWLLAVPALGATTFARFDLVPGVLVGVTVILLVSHPRLAAAAAAMATGAKLWPAVVLPGLAARARTRRQVVLVVGAVGVLLAGVSVTVAGWARLLSPLTWQADRGLQIESVLATPAMIGWRLAPDRFTVAYTAHNAFEVSGPGVHTLLAVSDACTALLAVGLLMLWWRAWRQGEKLTGDTVAWLCLASVSGFMVSSKVLSPQYLLWLLPAAAAALAVARPGPTRLIRWVVVLLVATGLTQLVFPVMYGGLLQPQPDSTRALLVLAMRNLALVWLTAQAWAESWRRLGEEAQRGKELERQPPGPDGWDGRILR